MTVSVSPISLPALQAELARQLAQLGLPAAPWSVPRLADGKPALDVLIVGAGMCGLAAAAALRFQGIDRLRIIDAAPEGREGPWVTYARMETLRSPKDLAGPALAVPALSFRAWHAARFGEDAWGPLGKIPRTMWMDYLRWYRHALAIPVENDVRMTALRLRADGLVDADLLGPNGHETVTTRRLVLANGRDGLGGPHVPTMVRALAQQRWAHTSHAIDFSALRGHRVAVIGAGASAMDSAATALEHGAARVDLFIRRPDIPRINKLTGISNPGLVHGYQTLPDDWKWRVMDYSLDTHPPPPRASVLRVSRHANAHFHPASPLLSLREENGELAVHTPRGRYGVDFLICATGFSIDLAQRPELSALAPHIRRWSDKPLQADTEGAHAEPLGDSPDLGPAFEFQERAPGACPALGRVHCFNYAAALSHGKVSGDVPAVSVGAQRLALGLAGGLFQEDIALHYARMEAYDTPELLGDEWTDADLPSHEPRPCP